MSVKVPAAGEHTLSRCSKCKDTTNHTIVAMVGSRIARVQCNVCGSLHNHRASAPPARKEGTRRPAQPRRSKSEENWENLIAEMDVATAIPYSLQTPVKNGDLIDHPTFGLGKVAGVIRPNKMEVVFKQGVKLLRCTLKG